MLNTEVHVADVSGTAVAIAGAALVGLFVGSFLNVVVYRAPRSLSVVAPRSFCPTCRRQLKWWENVPVASWVVLRGRCRTCHESISPRYLVVEVVTAGAFAFAAWGWHGTSLAIGYCGLAATMISVSCVEYGGIRSPLSIAAAGTGVSEVAILITAGFHQNVRIALGSSAGLALGIALFAVLRRLDPACTDPRGHGRSALLVAGAWIGGLATLPILVGVAASIGSYLICLAGTWLALPDAPTRDRVDRSHHLVRSAFETPFVTAVSVGLVVSLVVAR